MKTIELTQGYVATVDDEDYDLVASYKWCASKNGKNNIYAKRESYGKKIYMHREILGLSCRERIDHIDGNGLNNTRENLRMSDAKQNGMNRGKQSNNTSGYKGVVLQKKCNRWQAQLTWRENGRRKNIYLGLYATPQEAAIAYNRAAIEMHGEFAKVNDL